MQVSVVLPTRQVVSLTLNDTAARVHDLKRALSDLVPLPSLLFSPTTPPPPPPAAGREDGKAEEEEEEEEEELELSDERLLIHCPPLVVLLPDIAEDDVQEEEEEEEEHQEAVEHTVQVFTPAGQCVTCHNCVSVFDVASAVARELHLSSVHDVVLLTRGATRRRALQVHEHLDAIDARFQQRGSNRTMALDLVLRIAAAHHCRLHVR